MNKISIKNWLDRQRKLNREGSLQYDRKLKLQKICGFEVINTTIAKKEALLKLAEEKGSKKPIARKHTLGLYLCSYTNSNSKSYDINFSNKVKRLRPDWFEDTKNLIKINYLKWQRKD